MEKIQISYSHREMLLGAIMDIMMEKGLKGTTMDLIANRLSISKRTLYEIFGSKDDMFSDVLAYFRNQHGMKIMEIMKENADNMILALISVLEFNVEVIRKINVSFFCDMDTKFRKLRNQYHSPSEWNNNMIRVYKLGVKQGVFRDDVNYELMQRLLYIQMESLKRMEELFPPDVTLAEACEAIILGFLRSIASERGREVLEEYLMGKKI